MIYYTENVVVAFGIFLHVKFGDVVEVLSVLFLNSTQRSWKRVDLSLRRYCRS